MRNLKGLCCSLGTALLFLGLCLGLGSRLLTSVYAGGGVINVASDGQDRPDCGLAPACRTIRYAVENRADPGDRVQVAAGTFTETFTVITPGLKIYGSGLTIIDGQNERGPMVTFGVGLTSSTVFSGFIVQNGLAVTNGGGLKLVNSDPTIQFLTLFNNTAPGGAGGGMYVLDSSPLITAVQIRQNTAITGGALYATGESAPALHGNTICGNSAVQLHNDGLGSIEATGNWWGTNAPQAGLAYSGAVAASPPISVNLEIQQSGSGIVPGGTTSLPPGASGDVLVSVRGGGYAPPAGAQITLATDNGIFANNVSTITLALTDGFAGTVVTPTTTGSTGLNDPVTISAFHSCNPSVAVDSITINILGAITRLYLPVVFKNHTTSICPLTSTAQFEVIPVPPPPADHPDSLHGDFNLELRGYNLVEGVALNLVIIPADNPPDPLAPQLSRLFGDHRLPGFNAAYQVNDWIWDCEGHEHGCRGDPLSKWETTLIGMETTPGEEIFIPSRPPEIFSQNDKHYKALVLYAEENRITLNYTREDTVAHGYSVHLENICVDPELLSLYRDQVKDGDRISNTLPALTEDQALGIAMGAEMKVAIRDRGRFMDPRSQNDWWQLRLRGKRYSDFAHR